MGTFAADDDFTLLCYWETKKDDEGLVSYSTTSSSHSDCISCTLSKKGNTCPASEYYTPITALTCSLSDSCLATSGFPFRPHRHDVMWGLFPRFVNSYSKSCIGIWSFDPLEE